MTCTDDRLEELDFLAPEEMTPDPPNLLDVDFDSIPYSDGTLALGPMTPSPMRAEFFAWLCNCTPGRGEYMTGRGAGGRGGEASLSLFDEVAMEYHRWDPPLPPTPSRELVVIQPHVF